MKWHYINFKKTYKKSSENHKNDTDKKRTEIDHTFGTRDFYCGVWTMMGAFGGFWRWPERQGRNTFKNNEGTKHKDPSYLQKHIKTNEITTCWIRLDDPSVQNT